MAFNLRNRSFLKEIDFQPRELRFLLQLSAALKQAKYAGNEVKRLDGNEIALIFEKTSTRTRSAFEVAAFDQGAHVTYLDPTGSQLGHKESIADTARVLGRMYGAIEFRGNKHADRAARRRSGQPLSAQENGIVLIALTLFNAVLPSMSAGGRPSRVEAFGP